MNKAYRIAAGRLSEHELPASGLLLPASSSDPSRLEGGNVDTSWLAILPAAARLICRIAPWSEIWFGPVVYADRDGRKYWGGMAYPDAGVALVAVNGGPEHVISTLFHELFHLVEPYLSDGLRDVLFAVSDGGPSWNDEYLNRSHERHARMFEHFSSYVFEGGRLIASDSLPESTVLAAVYDGSAGHDIADAGFFPRERLPTAEALRDLEPLGALELQVAAIRIRILQELLEAT